MGIATKDDDFVLEHDEFMTPKDIPEELFWSRRMFGCRAWVRETELDKLVPVSVEMAVEAMGVIFVS